MKFKNPLSGHARDTFAEVVKKPRILSCPEGIVCYIPLTKDSTATSMLAAVLNPEMEEIERKIKEILATNPKADLKTYEAALGITILSFEPAPIPERPKKHPGYMGWG